MNRMRSRNGFSLIELLTVIAIIAILAAIIFPVMATVKKRAQTTKCMTNMYNISMALKMFKQDNNRYPTSLAGEVQFNGSNIIPLDQTKGDCLFPEYTKGGSGVETFHCPLAQTTAKNAVVRTPDGKLFYAYDSYDVYTSGLVQGGNGVDATAEDIRYTINWAPDLLSVTNSTLVGTNPPEVDYKRQLRFKFPPDNTVVTWCNYHATGVTSKEKIPVLYLTGQVEQKPIDQVMASKWRTSPGN